MVSEQLMKYSDKIPIYLEKISVELQENSDL